MDKSDESAHTLSPQKGYTGLFAKALEEFRAARILVASWLPSSDVSEKRLVVDDLGVRIKDFALDPAQDLIVLLEHRPAVGPIASTSPTVGADIRVHLRKLSAGVVAPHPAAKNPVLCMRALGPVHGCMIQIVEDVVGMYFWMPFHGVLIWNWMTGEELVFIQENQAPDRIWDFSFLSPRAYMVTRLKDSGEIRIHNFANSSSQASDTRRHVASHHRTSTASFWSSPRRRARSWPVHLPTCHLLLRATRAFTFSLYNDLAAHRGRWQPACFVVRNRTPM
ncbi:hypothetical protein BJV74DRAFT_887389 [Russula compacta]|nr:hypothetical protein BJV74DRAFT_887389 [Russula compacta]